MSRSLGGPGYLIYKCRLCGEQYASGAPRHLLATLIDATHEESLREANLTEVHCCHDGRLGVADLQGGELRES